MAETPKEWKTIRIDAGSYHKLNEISGLFTAIFGIQFSISSVAKLASDYFYFLRINTLRELVVNPDKAAKIRKEFQQDVEKLEDLLKDI